MPSFIVPRKNGIMRLYISHMTIYNYIRNYDAHKWRQFSDIIMGALLYTVIEVIKTVSLAISIIAYVCFLVVKIRAQ